MRRKGIALFIVTALVTAILSTAIAFAAESKGVTWVLDTEAKKLTVDIQAGVLTPKSKADLVIMKPGKALADASSTDAVFFADYVFSDSYGRANYVVDMQTAALGIYAVYLIPSDGGKTIADTITYLQGSFESDFLDKINGDEGADAESMKTLMTGEDALTFLKNQLGTVPEEDTLLYGYMVSQRPYSALYEIQDAHTTGSLLALVSEGSAVQRQELLANYGVGYLGIDQNAAMYDMYRNSTRREAICGNIPKGLATPDAVAKALYDATILTTVQMSSWNEMPSVFESAESYLTDIDYDKLNENITKVSKATAGKTYETISDFESAIRAAYATTTNPDTGGGSGSFGGSSGSVGSAGSSFVGGNGIEVGEPVYEYESESVLFTDWEEIPSYAKSYLTRLYTDHVFVGDPDGRFRPNDAILRQEICKILIAGLKPEAEGAEITFTDVSEDAWYAEYVRKATAAGYIKGKPDLSFGVDETLTREDLAVILARILNTEDIEAASEKAYSDAGDISDYAVDAVNFVTAKEIMEGYDGVFDPKGQVTRAQAAKVMGKLLYEIQGGDAE